MYNLEQLRHDEFPISQNLLYFNHAGISPLPTRTRQKIHWAIDRLGEDPVTHWHEDYDAMVMPFRGEIRQYVNAASVEEVIPVFNTSLGFNLVAQAIQFEAGDNIAFCEIEFPSNAYPWMSLQRDGVEIRLVPATNGGLTLETLAQYVDERTRLVAVSAVQFFTGHRADLAALGAFCRERGILLAVDGIQAAGHIPIDVQAMNIDILVTGAQKSLIGPPGTGFMYVREAVAEKMNPRIITATSTVNWINWLEYDITPSPGIERFRSSTPNISDLFGLRESMCLITELGIQNIDRHTSELVEYSFELMGRLGYETITPRDSHASIGVFRLEMSAEEADNLVSYLKAHQVRAIKHMSQERKPHLRLSFHCYNTKQELDQFEAIIRDYKK